MADDLASKLHSLGYRLTPQRQLVLEAVDSLEHATPDDILVEVRKTASGVNISTVYRTLELLEELGLVSHAQRVQPSRPSPTSALSNGRRSGRGSPGERLSLTVPAATGVGTAGRVAHAEVMTAQATIVRRNSDVDEMLMVGSIQG